MKEEDIQVLLWRPLFISGIISLLFSSSLSGGETPGIFGPEARQWRTIAGEFRDPGLADRFLRQLLERSSATALSVAVVQGSSVVFQTSLGVVDEKTRSPVDEQTVFRAASLSKPVFAYLVMKLVDEGLFDLDKPVYQYLKRPLHEYPDYADLRDDDRYELLTVRNLLSHQSGFPNWRVMNRDRRLDFKFTPGRMFKYSGEGYRLLQFVLEEMTGQDLNRLAGEKVFTPLGMAHTSFLWEERFDGRFAVNLRTGLRRLIERTKTVPNAAASLLTNPSDYAKFLLAVMNGGDLKPESLKMMLDPQVKITSESLHSPQDTDSSIRRIHQLAWSLGWGCFSSPQGKAIFHVGYEEGCDNYAVIYLGRKTGIVLQSVITRLRGIAPGIAKELIGDVYSPFSWLQY